jgi:hypothetical protein
LDIIHRPVLYLKHGVREIGFCLRLQMEPVQTGPIERASLSPIDVVSGVRRQRLALSVGPI